MTQKAKDSMIGYAKIEKNNVSALVLVDLLRTEIPFSAPGMAVAVFKDRLYIASELATIPRVEVLRAAIPTQELAQALDVCDMTYGCENYLIHASETVRVFGSVANSLAADVLKVCLAKAEVAGIIALSELSTSKDFTEWIGQKNKGRSGVFFPWFAHVVFVDGV